MMKILTIAIPTYNRFNYLIELLESIKSNANDINIDLFKVKIIDNNSTDDTATLVERRFDFECHYQKNDINIGMLRNIEKAYTEIDTHYVWVIGDDDLIPIGAIDSIISCILKNRPGLIINKEVGHKSLFKLPNFFPNYRVFANFAEATNPYMLISHSLISSNIIKASTYDKEFHATISPGFLYDSHCAIIHGLSKNSLPVCHINESTLIVREHRADAHFEDLNKYHRDVAQAQIDFLTWEKEIFSLNSLNPQTVIENYYKIIQSDFYKLIS